MKVILIVGPKTRTHLISITKSSKDKDNSSIPLNATLGKRLKKPSKKIIDLINMPANFIMIQFNMCVV